MSEICSSELPKFVPAVVRHSIERIAMKKTLLMVLMFGLVAAGCSKPKGDTGEDKRASLKTMQEDTLARLYAAKPEAKAEINAAPGYAVFSNVGVGLLVLGTGQGYGVAVDNANGKETYMRMAQVSVGLGVGLKDFRAVFVFEDRETMDKFVNKGWQFGGEAEAGASSGEKGGQVGGAASANDKIKIYQFTESGVVLRAAVPLTKYWKYEELN